MFHHDDRLGGDFGGRMRAGRGMMEPAILQALASKPMHGYEIITTLEAGSHGMWRPSAGSVYPTLQLLEEKDYLTSHEQDGKKVYALTEAGKRAATESKQQHDNGWKERMQAFAGMHDFRQELGGAMQAMRTIMHEGTMEQKDQLKQAIADFSAALELITKDGE